MQTTHTAYKNVANDANLAFNIGIKFIYFTTAEKSQPWLNFIESKRVYDYA